MRPDASQTWAVVVARVGPQAKSRLAGVLGPSERSALARAMLADVLGACAQTFAERVLAVVDTPEAGALARARGALAVVDGFQCTAGRGMNAAVTRGIGLAMTHGAQRVLVVPGDVPRASGSAFVRLLTATGHAPRSVVVATDRAGQGTNALVLRPAGVIAPAFGPGSAERHVSAGRAAGAATAVVVEPELALDVDTPADLDALVAAGPAGETGAMLAGWVSHIR